MRKIKIILLAIFVLSCTTACVELIGSFGSVSSDPKLQWRTLTTDHFNVHYYVEIREEAQKVAQYCEQAHAYLTQELQHSPWGRVDVVVADVKDEADAKAIQFPYPQLLIFLARPAPDEALDNYDNWLRMVVFHEYTHIVSMDMAKGFWGGLRYVLGRTIVPNSILPTWLTEGYAVFQEAQEKNVGRNTSAYVDMVLRMDSLENHFPPMDTLHSVSGSWPFGGQAYFHGGRFFKWLAEKNPKSEFAEFHRRYSRNFLNFVLLEYHAKRLFGKSFLALYRDYQNDLRTQYEAQMQKISQKGLITGKRITQDQGQKLGLIFSPKGSNLIYSLRDPDVRSRILEINPSTRQSRTLVYDTLFKDPTWNPKNSNLVFSNTGVWKEYYEYDTLVELSWPDFKKTKAIEFKRTAAKPASQVARDANAASRRFSNPAFSTDGSTLAFVGQDGGTQNLWIAQEDPNGQHEWAKTKFSLRQITHGAPGTQYNQPRIAPDGKRIAVSVFDAQRGQRDLWLVDTQGKLIKKITDDSFHDLSPLFSPDGKNLYFVSDRTGVFNLFVTNLESDKTFQITNVLGGVFSPVLSADGKSIAYLGYHARGFDIYKLDLDPHLFFSTATQRLASPDPSNTDASDPVVNQEDVAYSPFTRLLVPRFLSPTFLINNENDFSVGFAIGSTDPLRKHLWSLSGNYRTQINDIGGSFEYVYTGWYPQFGIAGAVVPIERSGFLYAQSPINGAVVGFPGQFSDNILVQREYIGKTGLSMKLPIRRLGFLSWVPGKHTVGAYYEFIRRQNRSDINPPFVRFQGSTALVPVFPVTEYDASGFEFLYAYDSTLEKYRSISPYGEINTARDWLKGYSLSLGYEYFSDTLGGNWNQHVLRGDFRQYRRIPFTHHHVLALRGAGGITYGEDSNPETFSLGGAYSESAVNTRTRNFYPLRGFGGTVATGEQFMLLSAEYRFPIWQPERGFGNLPLFVKSIHAAGFVDYGDARDRFFTNSSLDFFRGFMGTGFELRGDFRWFYNVPLKGRLGLAFPLLANKNNVFDVGDYELILNFGTSF